MTKIREKLEALNLRQDWVTRWDIAIELLTQRTTGVDDDRLDLAYGARSTQIEYRDELMDEIERDFADLEGKSYAEIQPCLAECLERFKEVLGETTDMGNTIWAYTMVACAEIERLREKDEHTN